jgi:hypothetical protein
MPVIGRFRLRRESRRAFLQFEARSISFAEKLLRMCDAPAALRSSRRPSAVSGPILTERAQPQSSRTRQALQIADHAAGVR